MTEKIKSDEKPSGVDYNEAIVLDASILEEWLEEWHRDNASLAPSSVATERFSKSEDLSTGRGSGEGMNEDKTVLVRVGDSVLTRDLVWCECGRGLSRTGRWLFCPSCGSRIDQGSYAAACLEAEANGRMHFSYHDADMINQIVQMDAVLQKIALHVPTVCYEHDERRYVNIEEVFGLKRIAADARGVDSVPPIREGE